MDWSNGIPPRQACSFGASFIFPTFLLLHTKNSIITMNPKPIPRFKILPGPKSQQNDIPEEEQDSGDLIRTKALKKGVLALPGTVFLPNGRKTAYARAAFSVLDEKDVDEALRRLREAILDGRGKEVE